METYGHWQLWTKVIALRRASAGQSLQRYLRLFPAAIVIAFATLAISSATTALVADDREVTRKFGLTLHALQAGHIWLVPASTLVQPEPPLKWIMPFLVLASVALLEYEVGTWRTIVTFFLSDWIGSPLMLLLLWGLGAAGWSEAHQYANRGDAGASAAVLGTLVAAFLLLRPPWRNLLLASTIFYLLVQFSFLTPDVSIVHTLGAIVGLVAGLILLRADRLRQVNTREFWLTRFLARAWRLAIRSP